MPTRFVLLLPVLTLALVAGSGRLQAQSVGTAASVQSITTTFSAGSATTQTVGSSSVTFKNDSLSIVTMKDTAGNTYTIDATSSTATLRTDSSGELSQASAWYMGSASATSGTTLYGTYNSGNPASLLVGNNLLRGADNVFINSDTGTPAAQGNVERIDFLYNGTAGVNYNSNLAIGVFDRGTGDSFSIAVITGVDSLTGAPSAYGGFQTITAGQFTGGGLLNSASLSSTAASLVLNASSNTTPTDYLIRYDSSTAMTSGTIASTTPQNISGVVITLASLGLSSSTKIYGYSLMGGDVTPGTNLSSLINWQNTSVYGQSTNEAAFDGLDPVAVNGVLFSMQPVPEPSTYAEVFLTGAIALWGFRRRRKADLAVK